jgi:hypothetical protein
MTYGIRTTTHVENNLQLVQNKSSLYLSITPYFYKYNETYIEDFFGNQYI